jgi:hypothetical protein
MVYIKQLKDSLPPEWKQTTSRNVNRAKMRMSRTGGKGGGGADMPTMWSHSDSSEPLTESQNSGVQDGQCTYNITLKHVCATIIAVVKAMCYIFWVCVFSLRYPACNAHAPYCHLWPVRLYNIFPHYLINGMIFGGGGKLLNIKGILIFSSAFVLNTSHSKNCARCDQKCILVSMYCTCYSCQILTNLEFSRQIFENNQILWKSVQWEPSCSMGSELIVAFRNSVNAPKNW